MRSIKTTTTEAVINDIAWINAIILVAGSAAATIVLNDSTDGTGTDLIELKVGANDSKPFSFGEKGVKFDTAVHSTITGTGAVAYVYFR